VKFSQGKIRQKLITSEVPGTEESASNFVFNIKFVFKSKKFHLCVTWHFHCLSFTKWEWVYKCQNSVFFFSKITKAIFKRVVL